MYRNMCVYVCHMRRRIHVFVCVSAHEVCHMRRRIHVSAHVCVCVSYEEEDTCIGTCVCMCVI
jgi:hypothetical protein